MSKINISLGAERSILSYLAADPKNFYDIDNVFITDTDFSNVFTQHIYLAIKDIVQEQTTPAPIDAILLEEKIASKFPNIYSANKSEFAATIRAVKESNIPQDIKNYLRIVASDSIKRQSKIKLAEIIEGVEQFNEPAEIVEFVEKKVFEFTNDAINETDIENVASDYETYLARLAEEVKKSQDGLVKPGLSTGIQHLDKAIGGGLRRKTINVIAARAGYGKSLLANNIALALLTQKAPVLLLDTELDKDTQMNRIMAIKTKIPINKIETGQIFADPLKSSMVIAGQKEIKEAEFDYVSIKGWSIQEQTSVIRRWLSKRVGRQEDGQFRHAVVILDYLKLMDARDKGQSEEYETLGYRMTALHDLMSQYGVSMVMFAQQNREGMDKQDESTISGSDRIIWLCDSFSILYKVPTLGDPAEASAMADENNQYPNMGLRVCKCRHGRGTPPRRYVGLYCDKEDPRIHEEDVCGRFIDKGMKVMVDV